ncbi:MAG: zinc ribbon domain-containing protein, partial [Oscillospiraceae bacterium]|nr:zinc ribbon domain-containing protein [Oscillospiraceae bacterium]
MICKQCGTENDPGSKFCSECGAPLPAAPAAEPETITEEPSVPENAPAASAQEPVPVNTPVPETPVTPDSPAPAPQPAAPAPSAPASNAGTFASPAAVPEKPKKSKAGLVIGVVLALVVLLAAAAVFLYLRMNRTTEIHLTDYLDVSYEGYDGLGSARISLDLQRVVQNIADARRLSPDGVDPYASPDDNPESWRQIIALLQKARIAKELSDGKWAVLDDGIYQGDDWSGLSNGDTFTLAVFVDPEQAEQVRLSCPETPLPFVVSGLESLPEYDPFEDLNLTVWGISGSGYLELEYEGTRDDVYSYMFSAEPDSELSNGDTVTVSFAYEPEFMLFVPARTEMTFTVEGLDFYVSDPSQLRAGDLDKLKAAALEEVLEAQQDENYDTQQVTEPAFCGFIFAHAPEMDLLNSNELYLVYKSRITPASEDEIPFWVYYPVWTCDIMNCDDVMEEAIIGYVEGSFYYQDDYYPDGFLDPYELCREIRSEIEDDWIVSFDGEIAACEEGDGIVASLDDLTDEALAILVENALARAKAQEEIDYADDPDYTFSNWAHIGEYFSLDPSDL